MRDFLTPDVEFDAVYLKLQLFNRELFEKPYIVAYNIWVFQKHMKLRILQGENAILQDHTFLHECC